MRLPKLLDNELIRLIVPSLRFAILTAIIDIVMLATLYATLRLAAGESKDRNICLFLLLLLGYSWMYHKLNRDITQAVQRYISQIRLSLMDRLRKTDVYALEKMGIEEIYTALTIDIQAVSHAAHLIVDTVWCGTVICAALAYIAILSWHAFFLAVSVLLLGGIFYASNQIVVKRALNQSREREKNLLETLTHLLEGFKELRLNAEKSDDFFQRSLTPHAAELQRSNLQANHYLVNTDTIVYSLWQGLMMALIFVLPILGVASRHILLPCVGIIVYLPVDVLMEEVPSLVLANFSLKRLYALEQILEQLAQENWAQAAAFAHAPFETLSYEQLTFDYEIAGGGSFAVGPLSLTLQPGEIVFITGGNGSGKTTALKMLLGFYPATAGQIRLNGQAINAVQHRHLFAPIFSDFHLFDRFYGVAAVDPAKVQALLTRLELADKVRFTEGQFSTLDLSTGQKKRLALVIAMLEEKPIYVFDEWAAEQDPHFRQYFYETLLGEFKAQGKTVILVTHDDRYFHVADRLITMDYGRITAITDKQQT